MSKERIIVFGRGQYYKYKEKSIKEEFEIVGYLDNNPESIFAKDQENNLPVKRPEETAYFDNRIRIMIMGSRESFIEMTKQLLELEINEERILFGINYNPQFDAAEELIKKTRGGVKVENGTLVLYGDLGERSIYDIETYRETIRDIACQQNEVRAAIKNMPCQPVSRRFGREFGTPVDRFYIEQFLSDNKDYIRGKCIEIAEDTYMRRFGEKDCEKMVMHVNGWNGAHKGNLATGEGITGEMADCLICTQTIQMIYEIKAAMKNIYRLLKHGGTALITIHCISQISMNDYRNWGEYWRVTPMALLQMAKESGFKDDNIFLQSYGNVKTVICHLYGMCQEELSIQDYEYNDEQYPLIIGIRAKKD